MSEIWPSCSVAGPLMLDSMDGKARGGDYRVFCLQVDCSLNSSYLDGGEPFIPATSSSIANP